MNMMKNGCIWRRLQCLWYHLSFEYAKEERVTVNSDRYRVIIKDYFFLIVTENKQEEFGFQQESATKP